MIYTVTLNPALDKTVEIDSFEVDRVNRISKLRTDPGGKGINVSKVIQKLGGESVACAILGGHTGNAILTALDALGITTLCRLENGETRTNLKVIDPVRHTNTDINEPGLVVSEALLNDFLAELSAKIVPGDIVVISGSLPKGAPKDTYGTWVKALKECDAKVFLDADGELLRNGLKSAPDLIKPNNHELSDLMGRELSDVASLKAAAMELMQEYKLSRIVVSMGSQGALYVDANETVYAKGLKVPVGSTVGAGDSVVAAMAFAEERGLSLVESVRLSTATGAANVMCSGSQAAEYEVIASLLDKVEIQTGV